MPWAPSSLFYQVPILSSKLYIVVWTLLKGNFLSLASFILLFQEPAEISSFPELFVFSR